MIVALAAGCGTDQAAVDTSLSPAPPDGGQQLATEPYHLAPGHEIYMCYQFRSPDELVAITELDSIEAIGVHHMALYQPFGRTEEEAPHECATLIKDTWQPIWASGNGGNKQLVTPAGTGFMIQPGSQYILQVHLQNSGDEAIDVRAGVNLTYDFAVDQITPGGIFAIGKQSFTVPATTPDFTIPVDCTINQAMNVFAEFPHMHKIGKALTTTKAGADGVPADFYSIDPWSFGNQPMDPLDVTIAPTDQMALTCHYTNPTGTPVPYGESSDNEMCFFVLFYYPYDNLDGCIDS